MDVHVTRIIEKIPRASLSIIAEEISGMVVKNTKPTNLVTFFKSYFDFSESSIVLNPAIAQVPFPHKNMTLITIMASKKIQGIYSDPFGDTRAKIKIAIIKKGDITARAANFELSSIQNLHKHDEINSVHLRSVYAFVV